MADQPISIDAQEDRYLIRKGGAFYRPNAQGYTNVKAEAGRYTLAEAISYSHPNGLDGPRDGIDYMRDDEPAAPCLASVSSASAEGMSEAIADLDIEALASVVHDARWDQGSAASSWVPFNDETGTGKVYSLRIANAVQMHLLSLAADHIRDEPKLIEPVPATNQAGEVERETIAVSADDREDARKYIAGRCDAAEERGDRAITVNIPALRLALSEPAPATDGAGEVVAWRERDGDEWVYYDADSDTGKHIAAYQRDRHNVSVFPLYAALATQPAPSQEVEGTGWVAWNPDTGEEYTPNHPVESGECVEAENIRRSTPQEDTLWQGMQEQFMRAEALAAIIAATPTPPTLSVDLREALERIRDTGALRTEGGAHEECVELARAALAQVKAS